MKIIQGDLVLAAVNGKFDVIAHGCNCFCTMGAGIAKQIKGVFPEAYEADLKTVRGDKNKLGTYTKAYCRISEDDAIYVVNAYTQYHWMRGHDEKNIPCDYVAIRECMRAIRGEFSGQKIGMPMIGCGLAGGDWNIVTAIIQDELEGEDVTIMYL